MTTEPGDEIFWWPQGSTVLKERNREFLVRYVLLLGTLRTLACALTHLQDCRALLESYSVLYMFCQVTNLPACL